jgi:hypothetical protein
VLSVLLVLASGPFLVYGLAKTTKLSAPTLEKSSWFWGFLVVANFTLVPVVLYLANVEFDHALPDFSSPTQVQLRAMFVLGTMEVALITGLAQYFFRDTFAKSLLFAPVLLVSIMVWNTLLWWICAVGLLQLILSQLAHH